MRSVSASSALSRDSGLELNRFRILLISGVYQEYYQQYYLPNKTSSDISCVRSQLHSHLDLRLTDPDFL